MIWIDRLFAIAAKEARQLKRDRVTFGMIIGVPVIQMLLFGYAINFDVRDVDAAVLDQSRTSLSRQLVGDLQATQVLRVVHEAGSERELQKLMQRGDARVGIVIAADLERRLFEGDRSAVQLLVDGSQPSLEDLAQGLGSMPVLQRAGASAGGEPHFAIRTEYNPARRTAVQIVPALIGTILTMTMVIFTSGAIVRERERGNLELLITTPVTRGQLLAGKLLPYVIIGLIQTTLILGVGRLLFGVPMVGSLPRTFHFDHCADSVPGLPDGLRDHASVDPAVGFHVSVRGHARVCTSHCPGAAADPFQRDRSRDHAARGNARRHACPAPETGRISGRDVLPGGCTVPQATGLIH
ncbi:MAG: transport system permease protein [Steroidobacteraceae bacterium]|nr:transport system permease protein [Steroidobacteraceae bacterium]